MKNPNNPILAGMGNPVMQNIKAIKRTMQMVRNPQVMLSQMMQTNPQMKQVIDYVNANGGDPQKAFYKLAEEQNINPDEILNELREI